MHNIFDDSGVCMSVSDLKAFIKPGMHAHLIGIGGVSMSPLAEELLACGLKVTGSDISDGPAVAHLRAIGIPVSIGHRAENISGCSFIVRTAAVHDENPEIDAARSAGIPVFERAEAWGYLMRSYKNALCISGTHGKTTTTSMCAHILLAAQTDPTIMIGGTLPMLSAGHRIGHGDTILMESCEYYNSFLNFSPTIAVILNIEADHLDFFRDLEDVKASFTKFADLVPESGRIIVNADDQNAMDAVAATGREALTFGFSHTARVQGSGLTVSEGATEFDVTCDGQKYCHVVIHVPGRHNACNALAAAAAAWALGLPARAVTDGLASFRGAARRLEFKGTCRGAKVYDDYAHHPGELKALIDTVSSLNFNRILLAFQPHTYSRTKALFHEFVEQLRRPDRVFLADIYAAREKNTIGISSRDLADEIDGAVYCPSFEALEKELVGASRPGDIILTVGAGDIFKVGEAIVEKPV